MFNYDKEIIVGKTYSPIRVFFRDVLTLKETKDKITAASILSAIECENFFILLLWLCGLRLRTVERIAKRKLHEPIVD